MLCGDNGGGGEKRADPFSVSSMDFSEAGESHGGGRMEARRWRFSRRASQRGSGVR